MDLNSVKVFDKATVDTCIVNLSKQKPSQSHALNYANPTAKDLSTISYSQIPKDRILADCDDSDKSRKPFLASGDSESSPSLSGGARGWVNLTEKEHTAQIIKPILRGRDIKRYSYEWANLWLINTHNGYLLPNGEKIPRIDIADYPALKKHLDKFYPQLQKRTDKGATPYNLRNCAYYEEL